MKSPLIYASRCLSDMEDRWIPYSGLWWRFWTPRIPRGERYQEGAFTGYTNDDDDEDPSDMALLDIRRMLAIPLIRRIYEKLPYIDVAPITRPYEEMTPAQREQRNAFVIESTLAAYADGKALYPRSTIARIEAQLTAAGATLARRRKDHHHRRRNPLKRLSRGLRHKLFSHCEAPQTAFLSFPAYDGVTTHVSTWSPGAELAYANPSSDSESDSDTDDATAAPAAVYRPGRSQIEFRTIQELTQPDPGNVEEQFAPDSWMAAVGYQPVTVRMRPTAPEDMVDFFGDEAAQLGVEGLKGRLDEFCVKVRKEKEWGLIEGVVRERWGAELDGGVLRTVERVVFFYDTGMSGDDDYSKRATYVLAMVVCLRELLAELRGETSPGRKAIPIYMPAFGIMRRWNAAEQEFLRGNAVEFVESNGELFLKVDERTVVMSYRNWNPVKQVVADIAKPAMLICRPVSDDPEQDFAWEDEQDGDTDDEETIRVPVVRSRAIALYSIIVDPDSPRVRKLIEDYDGFELPELSGELPGELTGETASKEALKLYMRKPDASTKVEYL